MPPKSPLPPRHGLQAAWVRTPDRDPRNLLPWPTMRDWLVHKLAPAPEDVDALLADGAFADDAGRPWTGREEYRPHTFVWFHRTLRDEAEVPGELIVVHRDERIVVLDKPHFLSTIPAAGTSCRARWSRPASPWTCRTCRRHTGSTAAPPASS
ncbi:pseudouridine synthase family protein [Tessaracoccus coleopterorum]|uniref:hypothetical protein n=1 Tax=Tessaracoccus coleopterorum TaxID=2714950 RepID=UPI001E42367A|nr:hypothetical protein [Tessaracoccus coleopterorum]